MERFILNAHFDALYRNKILYSKSDPIDFKTMFPNSSIPKIQLINNKPVINPQFFRELLNGIIRKAKKILQTSFLHVDIISKLSSTINSILMRLFKQNKQIKKQDEKKKQLKNQRRIEFISESKPEIIIPPKYEPNIVPFQDNVNKLPLDKNYELNIITPELINIDERPRRQYMLRKSINIKKDSNYVSPIDASIVIKKLNLYPDDLDVLRSRLSMLLKYNDKLQYAKHNHENGCSCHVKYDMQYSDFRFRCQTNLLSSLPISKVFFVRFNASNFTIVGDVINYLNTPLDTSDHLDLNFSTIELDELCFDPTRYFSNYLYSYLSNLKY